MQDFTGVMGKLLVRLYFWKRLRPAIIIRNCTGTCLILVIPIMNRLTFNSISSLFKRIGVFVCLAGSSWAQPMLPFWKGKVMYNESVMMISKDGKQPEARLLFTPKRILKVTSSGLDKEYRKGIDWEYKDGKLYLLPGTSAVSMTGAELAPDSGRFKRVGGGYVLHQEGAFFHQHQLAVTYKHRKNQWKGPLPVFAGDRLPVTTDKLRRKEKIHILLFGDSIAAGANASGRANTAPDLPDWGELFAAEVRRAYGTEVVFTNTAVGGKTSAWGKDEAPQAVVAHQPDLVVLAFGMNDGTGKMAPEVFKENIASIINQAKAAKPATEFLLISTMLPNPESFFVGTQRDFKKVLEELTGPGCTLVDITAVHDELLQHKTYQDLTGNNINHPNDFLIRWYAQFLAGTLIPGDR